MLAARQVHYPKVTLRVRAVCVELFLSWGDSDMDRQATCLWMQDLLEHLGRCHDQWRQVEGHAAQYLAEAMRRDLEEFQRLLSNAG